jgi:hypothetical protein
LKPTDVQEAIARLLAEDIDETAAENLYDAAAASPAVQERLAQQILVDTCLHMELGKVQPSTEIVGAILDRVADEDDAEPAEAVMPDSTAAWVSPRAYDDRAGRRRAWRVLVPLAAACAAAVAAFFLVRGIADRRPSSAGPRVLGRLADIQGSVRVRQNGGAEQVVRPGQSIRRGERLRVGQGGYARIELADRSSVAVREQTTLIVGPTGAEQRGTALLLEEGAVFCVVQRRITPSEPFVVASAFGARAEVIGTRFEFLVDRVDNRPRATVRVERGFVKLVAGSGASGRVGALKEASVSSGGAPAPASAVRLAAIAPWREGRKPPAAVSDIVLREDFEQGLGRWKACAVFVLSPSRGSRPSGQLTIVDLPKAPYARSAPATGVGHGTRCALLVCRGIKCPSSGKTFRVPTGLCLKNRITACPVIVEWDFRLKKACGPSPRLKLFYRGVLTRRVLVSQPRDIVPGQWYRCRKEILWLDREEDASLVEEKDFVDGKRVYDAHARLGRESTIVIAGIDGEFEIDNIVVRSLREAGGKETK